MHSRQASGLDGVIGETWRVTHGEEAVCNVLGT